MDGLYVGQERAVRRLVERGYRPEDKSRLPELAIKWVVRAIPLLAFISTLAAVLIADGG